METVKISQKYQIVIPRSVRERMGLKPGLRMQVISFGDRIELVPIRPMYEMRGLLKGLDSSFERERVERV